MKRALIYSIIFHLLLFVFLNFLQSYFKSGTKKEEPISVLILPVKPEIKELPKKKQPFPPRTVERLPPIRQQRQPRDLSSIPKGNEGQDKRETKEEKNPLEQLKRENHFTQIKPHQKTDIFDRDVIAKFSSKKNDSNKSDTSQGITFSAKEFNDWGYLERLKEKIERVWHYPPQAVQRGIFGDLYIKFTIDRRGNLVSVELLRTSGYRMLDEAAMRALKDAQPFWPLPEDWQRDSLTITGHFIYTLQGFYLR